MPDMFNFSPDMQQYFNSLPIFVQETLKQNNVKVNSLEDLKELEAQGAEILTCGTCLNHYHLEDKLRVGSVTNMYDITESLLQAKKIIRP